AIVLATDAYNACPGGTPSNGVDPEPEPVYTVEDGFVIVEAFGGTSIDGSVFTFPAAAEGWAGFANMNTTLYPITVAEDSVITFTGSVPAGGSADVRFRFEFNPHPDVDPAFNTAAVTVSGADAATYSVNVPAQGANTFSSFIMYLDTRDVAVSVTDIAINVAATGPVDSDNDGVNDDQDAFPNDPSE
ncbi:MAG: glycosyl hydrolase, partial [Porticoccaceae bacterium]